MINKEFFSKYKNLCKKEFNTNARKYKIACAVGAGICAIALLGIAFIPVGTNLLIFTLTAENSVHAMSYMALAAGTSFMYHKEYKKEEEEEQDNQKKIDERWNKLQKKLNDCRDFSDIGISRYEYFKLLDRYDPESKISHYFEKNQRKQPKDFIGFAQSALKYSEIDNDVNKKSFNKGTNLGFFVIGSIILVVGVLALLPSGAGITALAAVGIGEAITLITTGSAPILHYVSKNIYNFYDIKKTAKNNNELKKEYADELIKELKNIDYKNKNCKFIDDNKLDKEFQHIFTRAIETKDEKLFKCLNENREISGKYCAIYNDKSSEQYNFIQKFKSPEPRLSSEDREREKRLDKILRKQIETKEMLRNLR